MCIRDSSNNSKRTTSLLIANEKWQDYYLTIFAKITAYYYVSCKIRMYLTLCKKTITNVQLSFMFKKFELSSEATTCLIRAVCDKSGVDFSVIESRISGPVSSNCLCPGSQQSHEGCFTRRCLHTLTRRLFLGVGTAFMKTRKDSKCANLNQGRPKTFSQNPLEHT